jgi:hypothetical protein
MSKLFFTTAIVTTLFMATGAGAAGTSLQHQVNLKADVGLVCASTSGITGDVIQVGANGSSSFVVDIGPQGVPEQHATLTFAKVYCNGSKTNVSLHRTGFKLVGAAAATEHFEDRIDYTVDVSWGGPTGNGIVALNETQNDADNDVGYKTGELVLNVHIIEKEGTFKAGQYLDALILKLEPTL